MSNPGEADGTPITSVRQLADYIAAGCKPSSAFRIGTEHEKFGFRWDDFVAPPYLPSDGQPGSIRDLLLGLSRMGGEPILDNGNIIGLKQGAASVSLEPAGQLELSGAPLETLHETWREFEAHYEQVRAVSGDLRMGFAPLGFHPMATRAAMPWMPKGRYAIMRRYMPQVGSLGLDMMTRTCTVQVNLDYASEQDMIRKLRVSLLLQPLATALFANSPFTEGRPNGYLSYRAQIWTDTDNQRAGIPKVMFEPGFGFERFVDWVVDTVPMYFIHRDGGYVDLAGRSFRAFMNGGVDGCHPTVGDFADHITTAFTDVRLKRFLEMRGADAGRLEMMVALSAFWVGLLYEPSALAAAEAILRGATWESANAARAAVPRRGLAAPWAHGGLRTGNLRALASEVVAIATDGLRSRARRNQAGDDETIYLEPLRAIAAGSPTQAEVCIKAYDEQWAGDIRQLWSTVAI